MYALLATLLYYQLLFSYCVYFVMENKLLSLSRMLALLTLSSNGQWRCLQCTSNLNDAHETRQLIAVLIGKSISNTR